MEDIARPIGNDYRVNDNILIKRSQQRLATRIFPKRSFCQQPTYDLPINMVVVINSSTSSIREMPPPIVTLEIEM
jgi:hypothetical protein